MARRGTNFDYYWVVKNFNIVIIGCYGYGENGQAWSPHLSTVLSGMGMVRMGKRACVFYLRACLRSSVYYHLIRFGVVRSIIIGKLVLICKRVLSTYKLE